MLGYKIESTKYILKPFLSNQHTLNLHFDHVIALHLLTKKSLDDFNFIQVGAFDGVECDPLRKYLIKYHWKGILLEPQPQPFQKLKQLYDKQSEIHTVQAAIGQEPGRITLYTLEGEDLPNWSKGMASFNKENILKHRDLIPDLDQYIKPIEIETIPFEQILDRYEIKTLDLLQVDTEGFDGEIIKLFPMKKIKPTIIHFEYKHLNKKDLEHILDYLIDLGYDIVQENGEDMIAVFHTDQVAK